jgi:hypothetical protein
VGSTNGPSIRASMVRGGAGRTEMAPVETTIVEWLEIIRGEYTEIPGLCLTKKQAQRLWNLDSQTCEGLLEALVGRGFLRVTENGRYARVDFWPMILI